MEIIEKVIELVQLIHGVIVDYYLNNPMFKIVLAFVPALIGIAYPLIIQTVSTYSAESGHPFRKSPDTFLVNYF